MVAMANSPAAGSALGTIATSDEVAEPKGSSGPTCG